MTKSIYYFCGRYLYVIMHYKIINHEMRNKSTNLKIISLRYLSSIITGMERGIR